MEIIQETAMECWKEALKLILDKGVDFKDENNRICREILNLKIVVKKPFFETSKPIKMLFGFNEWKYPHLDEISKTILTDKLESGYSYSYGVRIFNFQGKINQLNDFIIPLLKNTPNSRRAVISLWDPIADSSLSNRENPGLMLIDFKMRREKLNLTAIIRSNDVFFGWPANFYQLFVLQDYVKKALNCDFGNITIFSTSAHIFEDQFKFIEKILSRKD